MPGRSGPVVIRGPLLLVLLLAQLELVEVLLDGVEVLWKWRCRALNG